MGMTPSSSPHPGLRFIPREALGAVTPWKFGAVDGSDLIAPAPAPEPVAQIPVGIDTAAQQALIEQARAEAHAEGFAQGQEQTAAAWQRRMDEYLAGQGRTAATRLQALLQTLDASLSALQQQMAQQLLELACDIARQVLRQELSVNPRSLLPVVRQALTMLVTEGRPATVRLNPADLEALAQPLREAGDAPGVHWLADAAVPAGGCLVEAAGAMVDGRIDKRWQRAIAALGLQSPWQEGAAGDGDER
ncbi:flagellar assembly protein FliH [Verminephrobacter eiseniae EF01-2]|uniref:Flagellar assembly protein FliH n=3 Tax=Verminephrobacter eiseniae TaxID=364317 RepID=A1WGY2_VEREI|nr:flagellar assembly protein FliH [Verminephrobacter eiseniae EF01-2]